MSKRASKDCCARFSWKQCLFSAPIRDGEAGSLSEEEIDIMINSNAIGLATMNFIEMIIFSVWMFFSLVAGFATYNGTNSAHAVSHFAWWAFIELVVVWAGKGLGTFSISIPAENRSRLGLSVNDAIKHLNYYIFVLVIGMISNIVHIGLTFCEISSRTSTFTTDGYGFAVTFAIMLLVLLVPVQGFLLFRSFAYIATLEFARDHAQSLFDLSNSTTSNTPVLPPSAAGSSIDTESPFQFAKRSIAGKNKAT